MQHYDLIVIGGGPGGYVAAIKAAQSGKKTCLIEQHKLGGVCLNEGCIPTKTLLKTANLLHEFKHAESFAITGVDVAKLGVSLPKLQQRKQEVVERLVNGVSGLLQANKVTLVQGHAAFVDAQSIQVNGEQLKADNFIIATGSETLLPGFIEQNSTRIITSREALGLTSLPESIAIIGGGVIGIEFACLFNRLGCKVTVLELLPQILPMVDAQIADLARQHLEKAGIRFHLGTKVLAVQDKTVSFSLPEGAAQSLEADVILMAVGRVAQTSGLNLECLGLAMDKQAIKTNSQLQTSLPHIYAIGDVNGRSMLAHTASHEGLVAVANICGQPEVMLYDQIPACIYIEPEIASLGLTEEQAREKFSEIKVGTFPMLANGKAVLSGQTEGLLKVIVAADTGEICGAHLYCSHATDMIAELAVAMRLEATAEELIHTIHPHPTLSEAVAEAFMAATGKAVHYI